MKQKTLKQIKEQYLKIRYELELMWKNEKERYVVFQKRCKRAYRAKLEYIQNIESSDIYRKEYEKIDKDEDVFYKLSIMETIKFNRKTYMDLPDPEFHKEKDINGKEGMPDQIKDYETGYITVSDMIKCAKEHKMTLRQYLKWWWTETKPLIQFKWRDKGKDYNYQGTTIMKTDGDTIKEIYGQIVIEGKK